MASNIDFSCKDWSERIEQGRSLLPDGIKNNLSHDAEIALEIFSDLVLPDVPGTPRFGDSCGRWAFDLVAAIGGSVENNVRWCREFFVMVPKKNSKAIRINSLVQTIDGFKTIADIKIGDKVFGVDGRPINVIGKSELFVGRKCFEVEFHTGEKVVCDAEHLWLTEAMSDNRKASVKTTQEIADSLYNFEHWMLRNHRIKTPSQTLYNEDGSVFYVDTKKRPPYRHILNIKEIESEPTQCISVDAEDGQFLITEDYIPTHNTTIGAAIMLTMLMMNKRPNADYIIISPSISISDLSFSQLTGCIRCNEELNSLFQVRNHIKTIVFRPTNSKLSVKTCSPQIVTGIRPAAVLLDESHVLSGLNNASNVLTQLKGGMISQPESFFLTISTQSVNQPSGVFLSELSKARSVRDGKLSDLSICPLLYEFPEKYSKEWRNKKYWYMVNPNNGFSVDIDRLYEDYLAAVADGEAQLRLWASQHLNVEIGVGLTAGSWAGADFWDDNVDPEISLDYILQNSDTVAIGVDGGGLNDLLGLAVLGRHIETGKWIAWFHAWAHPKVLSILAQEVQQRLRDFEEDGDLTFSDNVGDDVEEVADLCLQIYDSGLMERIGVDRIGFGGTLESIINKGVPNDKIIAIPQNYHLNGAIITTERKLASRSLLHNGSRMMQWVIGNAVAELKGSAVYIAKSASKNKIDPLCALFDAVSILMVAPERKSDVMDWIA